MNCPKCETELPKNSLLCPICGARIVHNSQQADGTRKQSGSNRLYRAPQERSGQVSRPKASSDYTGGGFLPKRTFFFILAALCLAAAVILVVIGVKRTEQKQTVDGLKSLGRITLTYDEEKTINYMRGNTDRPVDEEEADAPYTVVFTNNQTQYGLIRYDLGVDTKEEFDELTAATADFVYTGDGFVEEGEPTQTLRKSTRQLYVYAWPKSEEESKNTPEDENSRYHFRFYDDLMSITDVEKQIQADLAVEQDSCASASVSSTVYFIIAAIPLLGGAYLLFLALTSDRKKTAR